MRALLDTNVIIDAVGGRDPAVRALEQAVRSEWVGYSAITRLEVLCYPNLTSDEERALRTVLGELVEVPVVAVIIDRAIRIRRACRIRTPDAIIAATALESNATLITRNTKDFSVVHDLAIQDPWA